MITNDASRKMPNILILESNTTAASDLAFTLTSWGCTVVGIAGNHQAAMDYCEKRDVDLLIAEIKIKNDHNSIETTFLLQEIYALPVIFLTSHTDTKTLTKVVRVDFSGFLIKPYREDDLLVLIRLVIVKYNLLKLTTDICCGYEYDIHQKKIYNNGTEIKLTSHEKLLFLLLFHERGALVTNKIIDEVVWNDTFVSDETRRQLFHRLKMKLPYDSIENVRGLGYKFK